MATIIISIICLIITIIALIRTKDKNERSVGSIFAFLFLLLFSVSIIVKMQEIGEKKAYINILKGKENPYEEIIRKDYLSNSDTIILKNIDTLYVKKNKK